MYAVSEHHKWSGTYSDLQLRIFVYIIIKS